MQKIGFKIGSYITLTALDTQETLIPMGYLHGRKLYVGKYPKISRENNYSTFYFPVDSVVNNYRDYVKNKRVDVEIIAEGRARWYRVAFCEELSILSEDRGTSMMEMLDAAETDTETDHFRPIEDYSEYLEVSKNSKYGKRCLKWRNCSNVNWILQHHLPQTSGRCAVIDLSCCDISKAENIRNACLIREVLHKHGYEPYLVAGHWETGEPPYAAERAYVVEAGYGETPQYFMSMIRQCLKSTRGTAVKAVVQWEDEETDGYAGYWMVGVVVSKVGSCVLSADDKKVSARLARLSTIYSRVIKRRSDPFHFDGMELPGSNLGRWLFHRLGIAYEMYEIPPEPNAQGIRRLKITKPWWNE